MKVGIITLISGGLNYGNTLQNYALQFFLNKMGISSYTILDKYNDFHIKFKWINLFMGIPIKHTIAILINYHDSRNSLFELLKRQEKFLLFERKNINYSDYFTKNGVPDNSIKDNYDSFVVGSDQVWNPEFKYIRLKFLNFVPRNKRISYAASFGVSKIPENLRQNYAAALNGMEHISVREGVGAAIVKDLINKEPTVHVDPTLLLTKKEWAAIAEKPKCYNNNKYIVSYFLGTKPDGAQEEIERISRELNVEIIYLSDLKHIKWYYIDPGEFIYLIQNCSFMYTDSFHGTVFSILMRVPFVVCDRIQNDTNNMNSRIYNLLEMFNLNSRVGTAENNYKISNAMKIDFPDVEKILSVERNRSEQYLKKAFDIK